MSATKTRYYVNQLGDLICEVRGDPALRVVVGSSSNFPLTAAQVAEQMNIAFRLGMQAKLEEIQNILGVRQ